MEAYKAALSDSKKKEPNKVVRILFISVVFIIFTTLCVLAGELFLRWYYKDVLSTATGLSYFSENSHKLFSVEMNPYGLRGTPVAPKHDGRFRIVVQGDSFTYGQGVYPAEKRFTEILNKTLSKDKFPQGVVVFNAGICGFNLENHIRYQQFIKNIHPDFVLYQWFLNDMKTMADFELVPPMMSNIRLHKFLLKKSVIYTLVNLRYEQIRTSIGKKASFDEDMITKFQDPNSKASKTADDLLEQLFQGYRSRGIDFGVVLFPGFFHDLANYKLEFIHERVLAICRRYDVKCLDLTSVYRGVPHAALWANDFDAHPGALAHEMAAKAIYDFYGDYWQGQAVSQASQ